MSEFDKNSPDKDDLPPFFKSWNGAYLFLMANLTFLIMLFYLFTRFFA